MKFVSVFLLLSCALALPRLPRRDTDSSSYQDTHENNAEAKLPEFAQMNLGSAPEVAPDAAPAVYYDAGSFPSESLPSSPILPDFANPFISSEAHALS